MASLGSFKTVLPPLCTFTRNPRRSLCHVPMIGMVSWRLRRLRNLRELWLAGDTRIELYRETFEHIRRYHKLDIEHLAMDFIQQFRKLEYIRILDRAWRIARTDDADDPDDKEENDKNDTVCSDAAAPDNSVVVVEEEEGEERTEAVAWGLTPWEVESDVPDAFDSRSPSIFR